VLEEIAERYRDLDFVASATISGRKIVTNVLIGNRAFSLEVDFKSSFPKELPQIKLISAAEFGHLPHVCWKSIVCYNDGEGLSIDCDRPTDVAIHALKLAVGVLPSTTTVNLNEFYNEYEGYWNQQDSVLPCQLFFDPQNSVCKIRVFEDNRGVAISMLSTSSSDNPSKNYSYAKQLNTHKTELRGYYLPLKECATAPLPGEKIDTRFLDEAIASLSEENLLALNEIISSGELPKRVTLLISQPRPSGGRSYYGVTLSARAVRAWLDNSYELKPEPITPLGIKRHTKQYLLERGGMGPNHYDKRVAIIGCGALGGRISELCLMNGITNLTLIDGQILSDENIFRHVLDSRFIGENKATALAESFTSRFPGVSIEAIPKQLKNISSLLESHDILIVAIGNPTIEREFNLQYRAGESPKDLSLLITTWLEADGVGGHSVLTDKSKGCLHCLYHRDSSPMLGSLTSLIASGQNVTKNLTGCGGSFVPYGAIHAIKTATILVEQLLSTLNNQRDDKYAYWTSDVNGENTNLELTPWFYDSLSPEAIENIKLIFNEGCPVCR
jgi:hypothetical protein